MGIKEEADLIEEVADSVHADADLSTRIMIINKIIRIKININRNRAMDSSNHHNLNPMHSLCNDKEVKLIINDIELYNNNINFSSLLSVSVAFVLISFFVYLFQ